MTKKEILDFQLPPRFEQVGNEHRKQMEDGKHRIGCCPDSNDRNWHEAADPGCPLFRRYRGESRPSADMPKSTRLTQLGHAAINFAVMHNSILPTQVW